MRSLIVNAVEGAATALLTRPTGNGYFFTKDADQKWLPEADVEYRLEEVIEGDQTVGWVAFDEEDNQEHYDADGKLLHIVYRDGDTVTFAYSDGLLSTASDRYGRTITFSYAVRLLGVVTLPDGKTLTFSYDTEPKLTVVEYQGTSGLVVESDAVEYKYEDLNWPSALTGVVDESANRYATWTYDTEGRATSSVHGDPGSDVDRVTIAYGSGTSTVTHALGEMVDYGYVEQFGRGKMVSADKLCESCGGQSVQSRSYDANGYPDSTTDFLGVTTDHDYDARGLLTQKIESVNQTTTKRTIQTDWHPDFRVPTERRTYNAANVLAAKSNWTYNTRGQPLTKTETDPDTGATRTTTTTYCEQANIDAGTCPLVGLTTKVDGPRTDVSDRTTYTYYASDDATCASAPTTCPHRKGDLWKVTNALGHVTETLGYDGAGRVLSVKDPNGVITDSEYHPRGWLTARKVRGENNAVETDDAITRIEYWPTGLVKQVTQPDGAFTSFTYDDAHRLTDITAITGVGVSNTIHYTLDNAGNRLQEDTKDAGGVLKRTLSRLYNQLGQLQTQTDAYTHSTQFTYDADGQPDLTTDALNRTSEQDYDPLGRLQRTLQDVGGIEAETTFAYDAQDQLTKVTDPKGLNTEYIYNGLGDLTQLKSPDTGTTNYTVDAAGNRLTQTDARGILTTYTYDALNRLSTIAYSDGSTGVSYTYDNNNGPGGLCLSSEQFAKGHLSKITDASGSTLYCTNRFGQLTRKEQNSNGQVFTVLYTYTLGGQLASVAYPDGLLVDYVRDVQSRITEVGVTPAGQTRQVLLQQATYYPFGPVAGWIYGNGRQMQRSLNLNYEPGSLEDAASGGISLGYEFDAVGNLAKLRDADQAEPPKRTYQYDALSRLTETRNGTTNALLQGYSYDDTGNRLSATVRRTTINYAYPPTSHRLTKVGNVKRSYDAAGNTTAIGGAARQFVYNASGRMSQARAAGAVVMNYVYNGKGEQVRKYIGTASTYTVFDEAGHWLGDYDTAGAPIEQAIWLDDLPVGIVVASSNQLHYLQPDALGTPRVVIDPVRDVAVWKWDLISEAFGNSAPSQDPDGDTVPVVFNMRFPGQRFDAASGLSYNYFRDYESSTGRYVESDPIGLKGGISSYAYVNSKPLLNSDWLGLSDESDPEVPDSNDTSTWPLPGKCETEQQCLDKASRKVALCSRYLFRGGLTKVSLCQQYWGRWYPSYCYGKQSSSTCGAPGGCP